MDVAALKASTFPFLGFCSLLAGSWMADFVYWADVESFWTVGCTGCWESQCWAWTEGLHPETTFGGQCHP